MHPMITECGSNRRIPLLLGIRRLKPQAETAHCPTFPATSSCHQASDRADEPLNTKSREQYSKAEKRVGNSRLNSQTV